MHGTNANTIAYRNLTPIMHAAWNGFPEIVGILLKFGADPAIPDELGENALRYAALGGNREVIRPIRDAILAAPPPPGV
jgi:ankyrin repeat protein